jgi:hypothetical protein
MYNAAIIIPIRKDDAGSRPGRLILLMYRRIAGLFSAAEMGNSAFFLGSFSYVLRKLSSGINTYGYQQHTEVVFFFQLPAEHL